MGDPARCAINAFGIFVVAHVLVIVSEAPTVALVG